MFIQLGRLIGYLSPTISLTKVAEYLKKGSQVYIKGKLRSNQWADNEDKHVKP